MNALDTSLLELADLVGQALHAQREMLVTAESCTGGMIAQIMTAHAGSSGWFDRGFVTYTNQSKHELLNVSNATLDQYGAVSEQTVAEMLTGALNHSQATIAIAVSGIAGPGGGSDEKPVGTVWIGWARKDQLPTVKQFHFAGDRGAVRQAAAQTALNGVLDLVQQ